jgi:hypothetical protein
MMQRPTCWNSRGGGDFRTEQSGVHSLRKSGQTLAGFVRGKSMNVYAGGERIQPRASCTRRSMTVRALPTGRLDKGEARCKGGYLFHRGGGARDRGGGSTGTSVAGKGEQGRPATASKWRPANGSEVRPANGRAGGRQRASGRPANGRASGGGKRASKWRPANGRAGGDRAPLE